MKHPQKMTYETYVERIETKLKDLGKKLPRSKNYWLLDYDAMNTPDQAIRDYIN